MSRLRKLMNKLVQLHVGICRPILLALCLTPFFLGLELAAQHAPAAPAQKLVFDDQAATKLLSQLTQGLENANQKKVLSVFDFSHMEDGQRFQQQLISFVAHAESIRLHLNLVRVNSDSGKGSALADIEIEIEPRDGTLPVRKQARLSFSALSSAAGWKFIDVQPREFFSNNPGQ
jgi:hypothetical protein